MKIEVQVVVAFTVTAALTAAASYPAIARAASNGGAFRSYSGHQCKGPAIAYTLNVAQVVSWERLHPSKGLRQRSVRSSTIRAFRSTSRRLQRCT